MPHTTICPSGGTPRKWKRISKNTVVDTSNSDNSDKCGLPGKKHVAYNRQQHLKHGAGVVGMGGGVPEVVGLQPLVHQVASLGQQALPLHIHPMLLVPSCARPAKCECDLSAQQKTNRAHSTHPTTLAPRCACHADHECTANRAQHLPHAACPRWPPFCSQEDVIRICYQCTSDRAQHPSHDAYPADRECGVSAQQTEHSIHPMLLVPSFTRPTHHEEDIRMWYELIVISYD